MKKYDLESLRKTDFTSFITSKITNYGDKRKTLCPFHDERTPSFFIYPDNSYYCFGCGVHGNAIDFMVKRFNYSFTEACEMLENL